MKKIKIKRKEGISRMKKLFTLLVALTVTGCSSTYYKSYKTSDKGTLVVNAYTDKGCVRKLYERGDRLDLEVELKKVQPTLLGYKCIGSTTKLSAGS